MGYKVFLLIWFLSLEKIYCCMVRKNNFKLISSLKDEKLIFHVLQEGNNCCGYGTGGVGTVGYDCIIIPGAAKSVAPFDLNKSQAFCGQGGLVSALMGSIATKTICSKSSILFLYLNS